MEKTFRDQPVGTRRTRFLTQDYFPRTLVDEYIFSANYNKKDEKDKRKYWDLFLEREENRLMYRFWKEAQTLVPGFIEDCLEEIRARQPDVVGFTSMFGQNMSSLSLARRIKQELPQTVVVFGGANCAGEMGEALLRNFDQIDYVITGEAELNFPALITCIDEQGPPDNIGGIVWRDENGDVHHNGFTPPFRDLDMLPVPDYGDYFAALQETSYANEIEPMVFLEQSRGCWWGQKQHCTFCGLNADGMVYRKKSDERCLQDLREIAEQVPTRNIHYADNILDMKKFGGFLQHLKNENLGLSLFFEIKSNIPKEKVKILSDAGTYSIQPGIENFSTKVLKEMRKGVSGLQNVQCLKWCKQYGIEALWNVLYGFPGETKDDYRINLEILKSITHLDRQTCVEKIIMQRFSPNYDEAEAFGFTNIRPQQAYRYVYDISDEQLSRICYSFEYDYTSPPDVSEELQALLNFNRQWADEEESGAIVYMMLQDDGALIVDTRFNVERNILRLDDIENRVLRFLDKIRTEKSIIQYAGEINWHREQDVMDFVRSLQDQRFVISEGNRYLGVIPIPDDEAVDTDALPLISSAVGENSPALARQ